MNLDDTKMLLSFGFFMLIMYWMTLTTHNIFVNPILACHGYNLYDVTYNRNGYERVDVFLVKAPRLKTDERCRIAELSEQLFIVTEGEAAESMPDTLVLDGSLAPSAGSDKWLQLRQPFGLALPRKRVLQILPGALHDVRSPGGGEAYPSAAEKRRLRGEVIGRAFLATARITSGVHKQ